MILCVLTGHVVFEDELPNLIPSANEITTNHIQRELPSMNDNGAERQEPSSNTRSISDHRPFGQQGEDPTSIKTPQYVRADNNAVEKDHNDNVSSVGHDEKSKEVASDDGQTQHDRAAAAGTHEISHTHEEGQTRTPGHSPQTRTQTADVTSSIGGEKSLEAQNSDDTHEEQKEFKKHNTSTIGEYSTTEESTPDSPSSHAATKVQRKTTNTAANTEETQDKGENEHWLQKLQEFPWNAIAATVVILLIGCVITLLCNAYAKKKSASSQAKVQRTGLVYL